VGEWLTSKENDNGLTVAMFRAVIVVVAVVQIVILRSFARARCPGLNQRLGTVRVAELWVTASDDKISAG
jgi:hypothetical protein